MSKHHSLCSTLQRKFFWGALALLGYTYWVGARAKPKARQAVVEPIDAPVVVDAVQRASGYRSVQMARAWLMRRAVTGFRQARVLEVGSGAGHLALALARRREVREVIGVDLSHAMVLQAREAAECAGAPAEFFEMDAAELTFPDASIDVAVSMFTLHHLADPVGVLRQIHRVLRPGGRALIVDLRRDASPLVWGGISLLSPVLLPRALRETGEPLASFQAAYTPAEALLLAFKAGWDGGEVSTGPFWLTLELTKNRGQ
ncbi:MAG: class I SAM-dependent methyltransferase [Armatimonadota bacterium]